MELVHTIEKQLEGVFKSAPKIPENGRKTIAEILPWIALVFGLLMLVAAFILFGTAKVSNDLVDWADQISKAYGGKGVGISSFDKTMIYLGSFVLAIEAAISLMAFPKLSKQLKAGWELMFLASLINSAYAVLSLFTYGQGVGTFFLNALGAVIGFWILFQVKDKFTAGAPKASEAKK